MGNLGEFRVEDLPADNDFTPMPAGKYIGAIIASEIKTTNAGDGRYLSLTIEIIDGEHAGRRVWDILNLWNPSEKAVEIASRTLGSIYRSLGLPKVTDSSELHGQPLGLEMGIKPASGNFKASNKINRYFPANDDAPPAPAPAPAKAPWGKKADAIKPTATKPAAAPWAKKPAKGDAPPQDSPTGITDDDIPY